MQLMYLHSYQSLLFNTAVSHRLARYGITPVEGDLVLAGAAAPAAVAESAAAGDDEAAGSYDARTEVRTLSADDVASGRYSLDDVLLPLPGAAVALPDHETRGAIVAMLERDGLSLASFTNARQPRYSLSGAYRKVIARPNELVWRVARYTRADEQLQPTDLDRAAAATAEIAPQCGADAPGTSEDTDGLPAESHRALLVAFSLPPSSYATVCLRELTKQPMGTMHHAQLSAQNADCDSK